MKDKNKIIIQNKKKLNTLKKHNKFYYLKDDPQISDFEYDKIKKEILELEEKYLYLKKVDSLLVKLLEQNRQINLKKLDI